MDVAAPDPDEVVERLDEPLERFFLVRTERTLEAQQLANVQGSQPPLQDATSAGLSVPAGLSGRR